MGGLSMSLQFSGVVDAGLRLNTTWTIGLHCLLGALNEGPAAVLELASGKRAPQQGKVTLEQRVVHADPELRASIGVLTSAESWPSHWPLQRWLTQLAELHG